MSRSVPEWIGKTDDQAIPPRVRLRIFEKCQGKCVVCGNSIRGSLLPAYDHIVSLVNGGENRENNLQLLCVPCHKAKTAQDVKEKATVARKRMRHIGIRAKKKRKMGYKRFDGTVVKPRWE